MARTFSGTGTATAPAVVETIVCGYIVHHAFCEGSDKIKIADVPANQSYVKSIRVETLDVVEREFLLTHGTSQHLRKILAGAAWAGFEFGQTNALVPPLACAERRFWERNLDVRPIAKKFIAAGAKLAQQR